MQFPEWSILNKRSMRENHVDRTDVWNVPDKLNKRNWSPRTEMIECLANVSHSVATAFLTPSSSAAAALRSPVNRALRWITVPNYIDWFHGSENVLAWPARAVHVGKRAHISYTCTHAWLLLLQYIYSWSWGIPILSTGTEVNRSAIAPDLRAFNSHDRVVEC